MLASLCFLHDLSEFVHWFSWLYLFFEVGRSAEEETDQYERRCSEESGEDCHPEVSYQALPEERRLFISLRRIEVEEESTEGELKEETQVEDGESEEARRE